MDTQAKILSEKDCERIIQVEVPKDRILIAMDNMYNNIQKMAEIPGFRIGKAPKSMVEKYFKSRVESDVKEKIVSDSFKETLQKLEIDPIGNPSITELKFEAGKPLEYKISIEVRPKIDIKNYKGIKVKKEKIEASEDDVNKTIEYLRERNAEFSPVDSRAVQDKDFVIVDFKAFENDNELYELKTDNYIIEIGAKKTIPEFENNLIGVKINETKEITVDYKPDFTNKSIAGKKVLYKVTVKNIREKKLAVVDDEFAKDVGNYKTLDELKQNIKAQIIADKENRDRTRMINDIINELAKDIDFPLPKSLLKNEYNRLLNEYESMMKSRGLTYETTGKKKEEVEKELDEIAKKRIKSFLIVHEIGRLEKIEVNEQEIDSEINNILANAGKEKDQWTEYFNSERGRESVESQILQDKVLDFLLKEAKIEGGK
jgi:trigger factor